MTDKRIRFLVNSAYFAVIAAGVYVALRYALPVLLPFAAAYIIAAALRRAVVPLNKRFSRVPEKALAVMVLLLFYAFIGLSAGLFADILIKQLLDFAAALPSLLTELVNGVVSGSEKWLKYIPTWLRGSISESAQENGSLLTRLIDMLSEPMLELVSAAGNFALRLPAFVLGVVMTVTASFFILLDYERLGDMLRSLFPKRLAGSASGIRRCLIGTASHLLRSYGMLMLITFVELACGFAVINLLGGGISFAVPLALLISLVDILPVLGVGTVLIPWAVAGFLSGGGRLSIMLLVLYGIITIARSILEPRLVGRSVGLHPVLTLLALYVGGRLFGFAGMLLLPFGLIAAMRYRQQSEIRAEA